MPDDLTCPNCGYGLGEILRRAKMMDCPACGSTVYWKGEVLEKAGEAGVMHDAPLLVALGDVIELDGIAYHLIGHARFSYGRGFWDEFWAEDGRGYGAWISVDEGDVILQLPYEGLVDARPDTLYLGDRVTAGGRTYTVTEREMAECTGLRGAFPEVLAVGETYQFVNCAGEDGALLSGEFWEGHALWFLGQWLDPFAVARGKRAAGMG